MKIRIKGNSLRYRLSMTDVAQFDREGYIEEVVDFGSTRLTYALQKGANSSLEAEFANSKIVVFIPSAQADEWAKTGQVGFDHRHSRLYLLVEKDFKCIDNTSEDQSDNYPNPNMVC